MVYVYIHKFKWSWLIVILYAYVVLSFQDKHPSSNYEGELVIPVPFTTHIGVRSVEFNQGILSFGTGDGNVYFHDVRYPSDQVSNIKEQSMYLLKTSKGYLVSLDGRNTSLYVSMNF